MAGIAAAAVVGAGALAGLGLAQEPPVAATAFPMPGTPVARAETQISLRGVAPERVGAVEVSGSRSGAHPGALRAHSDGRGASFVPQRRFAQGETVTVRTGLAIPGARDGDYSFTVARRPSPRSGGDGTLKLPPLPPAAIDRFRSRRDMEAPVVRINRRAGGRERGLIFLAPFSPKGSPRPDGPLITDDRGDLVWFKPVRRGTAVTDLKVQELDGEPVITWWEGRFAVGWGYGAYKVFDSSYRQVATIRPGNGLTGGPARHAAHGPRHRAAALLRPRQARPALRGRRAHGPPDRQRGAGDRPRHGPRALRVAQRRARSRVATSRHAARRARARGTTSTSTPSRRTRTAT